MRRFPVLLVAVVLTAACARQGPRPALGAGAGATTPTPGATTAGVTTAGVTATAGGPGGASTTSTSGPASTGAPVTTAPPAPTSTVPLPPLPAVGTTRTGVVVPVVGRAGAAVKVTTPCGREATVSAVRAVSGVDVVLDAGHGGAEKGAIGPNGLTEATLNLAVTEAARTALQRAGLKVAMTRAGEYMMALSPRGKVVTALRPKAFVSIHHNAEPDGPHDGPGTETYYQIGSASSKRLAGLVWQEVHDALAPYQLDWVGDTDAGAKYRPGKSGDYYAVLRLTKGVTAALSELAFISDPAEADLLARPDVQQVEGEAVARGIVRYLRTGDPGSGFTEPYPRTDPAGGGGGSSGCIDPALE